MDKLEPKQRRFVEEYLLDANVRQAARRAGYNEMVGFRLMRKPAVAEAVRRAQDERAARIGVTADHVVRTLCAIAFSDIRNVMSWGGGAQVVDEPAAGPDGRYAFRIRASGKVDEATAQAVQEYRRYSCGAVRVRMHDKLGALMLLARHLGMIGPHRRRDGEAEAAAKPVPKHAFSEAQRAHFKALMRADDLLKDLV